MDLIPKDARVIILEGIAGSGKTTLKRQLKEVFRHREVYEFSEEELFLGWKHVHLPHLSPMRLAYYHILLDYIDHKLAEEPEAIFILERFHLSVIVLEWEFEANFEEDYRRLLDRLRRMPILILLAKLDPAKLKERMLHRERSRQWDNFIQEKLALRNYSDLERLSIDQQAAYFRQAQLQGIPYAATEVTYQERQGGW